MKLQKLRDSNWLEGIVQGFFIISTILFLFSPDYFFFKKSLEFANYVLVIFILCGLIFLIIDSNRLVITTFLCAGALALFLKVNSANVRPEKGIKNIDPISLSVIDLAKVEGGEKAFLRFVDSLNSDIYFFKNVDVQWEEYLSDHLAVNYDRYQTNRIPETAVCALYSTYNIGRIETLYSYDIPTIQAILNIGVNKELMLLGLDLPIPNSSEDYKKLNDALGVLAGQIHDQIPVFALGDFSLVPWSKEIQHFKSKSSMQGTVHKINPFPIFKAKDKSYRPTLHILHDQRITCLDFNDFYYGESMIGVAGKYQIKDE